MKPRDAGAYFQLGKLCRSQGRRPEAETALKKALELDPQNGGARMELGALYQEQERFPEAAAEFERAITIDGNSGWVHGQLGQIYRRQGRASEAEAALRKAQELDPRNEGVCIELGALFLDQEKFSEAVVEVEKAIALGRDNGWAHCELGKIYRRQGRPSKAEAALRKALEFDPQNICSCIELGAIYLDQCRLSEAAAEYEKAIVLDRDNSWAHCQLGRIYRKQGRSIDAEAVLHKAQDLGPCDDGACMELGALYEDQGRFLEAAVEFQKALAVNPRSSGAHFHLGEIHASSGRRLEAAAEFAKAIAVDPDYTSAHLSLGHSHLRLCRWVEADTEFQRVIALDPCNSGAYVGLWAVYRGQGRSSEAAAALAKAVAIDPNSAYACTELLERLDRDKAVDAQGRSGPAGRGALLAPGMPSDAMAAPTRERVFCLLPWTHLHIRTDGCARPCCMWDGPSMGNAHSSSIDELRNSSDMKTLRSDMMKGRPVAGCWKCYEEERSGFCSMRQRNNIVFERHRGRERLTAPDGTLPRLSVPFLDIRFSNVCNLRCRTCDATLSSSWVGDARALGLSVEGGGVRKSYDDWAALWRQLQPLLEEGIEEIVFAGGEPLIMEEHYQILDFLLARGLTDVRLRYNTNFSALRFQGRDVIGLWSRMHDVKVAASLDGSGRRGEYLRKGLRWDEVVANREEMLRRCPEVAFSIAATPSIFNALHLPDFHREWAEKGFIDRNAFTLNLLVAPAIYCMQVLPATLKARVLESYRRHQETFLDADGTAARDFAAAARFMEAQDRSDLLPGFLAMTRRLDWVRGEDCREVFPELAGIFETSE